MDRKAKIDYLGTVPNINNPGVKSHEKYKNFVDMVHNVHKSELKAWATPQQERTYLWPWIWLFVLFPNMVLDVSCWITEAAYSSVYLKIQ